MKISIIKQKKKLPAGSIQKYVIAQLATLWRQSAAQFVYAALEPMIGHIDTGMSVASFKPLAGQLRITSTIADILSGGGPKTGHKNLSGEWASNNAKYKSASLGASLGRRAYTLKFGDPKFEFRFKIVVFQHFLHESFENYSGSLDYESLRRGQEAFLAYWSANLPSRLDAKRIVKMMLETKYE